MVWIQDHDPPGDPLNLLQGSDSREKCPNEVVPVVCRAIGGFPVGTLPGLAKNPASLACPHSD